MIAPNGAHLLIKKGEGYQLIIDDAELFHRYINNLQSRESLDSQASREKFIINKILIENSQWTIDDFMSELYVSRTTIVTILQELKKLLEKYHLTISYDSQHGIKIDGEELEKRRFLVQYLLRSDHYEQFLIGGDKEFLPADKLLIIILEESRKLEFAISDFIIQNLILHIQLVAKRIADDFLITGEIIHTIEYSEASYVLSKNIFQRIADLYSLEFPDMEIKYIAAYISAMANQREIKEDTETLKLELAIQKALLNIKEHINFVIDLTLLEGLLLHFKPLLKRISLNVHLENPLLTDIRTEYQQEFSVIKLGFYQVDYFQDLQIDDNEWAYIALHILAAVERSQKRRKASVLVICSTGIGSSQMLKSRLTKEFSNQISIADVVSYYQITNINLTGIDFVLSTIDLQTSFFTVPVLKVNVLLTETDKKNIQSLLEQLQEQKESLPFKIAQDNQPANVVENYLDEKSYILIDGIPTKEEVLDVLISHLDEAQSMEFVEDYKNQLIIREKIGSVAFSPQIAIPHPAQPVAINSQVIFAYIPKGVYWDNDHSQIKIVILLSPSRFENKNFTVLTSLLANFLTKTEELNQFFEAPLFENLKQIILSENLDLEGENK